MWETTQAGKKSRSGEVVIQHDITKIQNKHKHKDTKLRDKILNTTLTRLSNMLGSETITTSNDAKLNF